MNWMKLGEGNSGICVITFLMKIIIEKIKRAEEIEQLSLLLKLVLFLNL